MKKRSKSKEKNISSSSLSNVNSGSNHHDTVINLGNLGYTFRKEFDDGWFEGKVNEIRPGASKYLRPSTFLNVVERICFV